jgi:hypothetical protein
VAVRSAQLAAVRVNGSITNQLVYTAPAGIRTLVKFASIVGTGNGQVLLLVRPLGTGTRLTIANPGTSSTPALLAQSMFVVLNASDQLLVTTGASSADVVVGGAELVV